MCVEWPRGRHEILLLFIVAAQQGGVETGGATVAERGVRYILYSSSIIPMRVHIVYNATRLDTAFFAGAIHYYKATAAADVYT